MKRTSIPRYRLFVSFWPIKNLVERADEPTLSLACVIRAEQAYLYRCRLPIRCRYRFKSDMIQALLPQKFHWTKNQQMAYSQHNGLRPFLM